MKVTAEWESGLLLKAQAEGEAPVVMIDATIPQGGTGQGMGPKKLLLASICGCTAMDVLGILEKMKVPFRTLRISATAEQTDTHPKVFKWVKLVYQIDAAAEDLGKVEKAVTLSQTKYCGVSIMIGAHCPVSYKVELL